ncbi:MAG: hypothetical protein JNJ73_00920 [Hyphomonadaceae bacterium]|nr:hypothetical protein [Hyphomonadaceae bacterium]
MATTFAASQQWRALTALAAALGTLALGVAAPPLAVLGVAAAGALALFRPATLSLRLHDIAGPALAAAIVGGFFGLDGAMGVLLIWRMLADARWAARRARAMTLAAGAAEERGPAALAVWTTPLVALTAAAYTAPHLLLGLPLDLPHVPLFIPLAAGAVAAFTLFDWSVQKLADWRLGTIAPAPTMLLVAHHIIFLAAFVASPDLSAGVMAMAVWRLAHARS